MMWLLTATSALPAGRARPTRRKYVLGLNKYSHDAGACLMSTDGAQQFVSLKERVTRAKHDGGDAAAAVEAVLAQAGASLDDCVAVCANHHHHRIAPFEAVLRYM